MLHVFAGNDREGVLGRLEASIHALAKKGPLTLERFDAESFSPGHIDEYAGAAGLFGERYGIVIEGALEEHEDEILARAQAMAQSANTFFLLEPKLLAKQRKVLQKHAEEVVEAAREGKKNAFNVFALTDALGKRDRKGLWVLFARARREGEGGESLHGLLFWMVKSMRAAALSKSATEAGLSPFVYTKAKSFSKNFSAEELKQLSHNLVVLYHEARRGWMDLDAALERFILSM